MIVRLLKMEVLIDDAVAEEHVGTGRLYCGYGATTPSHLGCKLAGPLCTAFISARRPQRRSTSSVMRALW